MHDNRVVDTVTLFSLCFLIRVILVDPYGEYTVPALRYHTGKDSEGGTRRPEHNGGGGRENRNET